MAKCKIRDRLVPFFGRSRFTFLSFTEPLKIGFALFGSLFFESYQKMRMYNILCLYVVWLFVAKFEKLGSLFYASFKEKSEPLFGFFGEVPYCLTFSVTYFLNSFRKLRSFGRKGAQMGFSQRYQI